MDYSFVVASDPQYPWTEKTDNGIYETEDEKISRSDFLIRNQFNSINDYSTSIGNKVIHTKINGDMTAYGHSWQWNKIESLMGTLKMPYSYGLGNHDLENNYGDTLFDTAWQNSFKKMFHFSAANTVAKDTWVENYLFGSYKYVGSLNYSQKIGDFRMITANNYPTMSNSSTYGQYVYWLTPGIDFIQKQLEEAQSSGQPAILYIHKPDGWNWGNDTEGRFKELLEKYYDNGTLRAVFTSHYHKAVGKVSYPEHFGHVPVYSTGGISQKTYLTVEATQAKNELQIYQVTGNVWSQRQLIDTIKINARGLSGVGEEKEYEQQKQLANSIGGSSAIFTSLNNKRALDDSDSSDDLIYFNLNEGANQKWKLVFSEATRSFTIKNTKNNFLMYESDSLNNGFKKIKTGSISPNDNRAQWKIVSAGSAYGTIPLYKLKNVRSGEILTLNSNKGSISDAAIGSTMLTQPDFGTSEAQKFMIAKR